MKALMYLCVFTFGLQVSAQMPVEKELHHKTIFENQWVRLIDMVVEPLDTTLLHTHSAASAVVFLSASTFAIQNVNQPTANTHVEPGDIVYRDYDKKPVTHNVWSADQSTFRCMVAEVKSHLSTEQCPTLKGPGPKLQWQQKLMNAYRLDLDDRKNVHLPKSPCPYLLIGFSGSTIVSFSDHQSVLNKGEFVFIPIGEELKIHSNQKAGSILLQLK